jgi:hypothetical protein
MRRQRLRLHHETDDDILLDSSWPPGAVAPVIIEEIAASRTVRSCRARGRRPHGHVEACELGHADEAIQPFPPMAERVLARAAELAARPGSGEFPTAPRCADAKLAILGVLF